MKQEHVKDSLSAYLDGILPEEEKRRVEEHLARCTECITALEELKKTLSLIHDLEDVEPPAWFTNKVMTRIKEEAGSRKGFFRRILGPIHSFIPLEALGAIAIAITMIVILRGMLPEMEKTYREESPEPPQAAQSNRQKEKLHEPQQFAEEKKDVLKKPSPLAQAPSTPEAFGSKGFAPSSEQDKIGLLEDRAAPVGKAEKGSVREMEMKEGAALRSAPAEPTAIKEPMEREAKPSVSAAPPAQPMLKQKALSMAEEEVRSAAKPVAPPLKKKIAAEREKRLIRIHLSVLSIDTVIEEIEEIAGLVKGKVIKTSRDKDKTIISLIIPSEKTHVLFEKLGMMGEITGKKMPSVEMKDTVEVEIEVSEKVVQ